VSGGLPVFDRSLIGRARALAAISGPDAVREHTGESDIDMAYVRAFGQATYLLSELADAVERLSETSNAGTS
jgi:hypothetical protein